MNKIFFICLTSLMICLGTQAQDRKVDFKLQPNGTFLSEDGSDFIVIEFDGMTAEELHSMVKNNVMSLYNSPKDVMSESGNNVITIFAIEKNIWQVKSLGATGIYGGHYKLVFKFKDGRIRIDAPTIDNKLEMTDGAFTNTIGIPSSVDLSKTAKKLCNSKKEKDKLKKASLESIVNNPINYLLGLSQSQKHNDSDDDW